MLVHNNENQVNRLIKHLSKDFDVYVHIDKRSSIFLLEKAYNKSYDRYLLISGQDLPIKSNDKIKAFFTNNKNEYIKIAKIPIDYTRPPMKNIIEYNINQKYNGNEQVIKYKLFYRFWRKIFCIISTYFPRKLDYDFHKGSNWTNYTHECVKKIFEYLKNDKKYIRRYKWTLCADEIFYQTILNKIEGINIINNCLRYIDWKTGPEYPRTLRINDYERIMKSEHLFARKFSETVDSEIIEKIYKMTEKSEASA